MPDISYAYETARRFWSLDWKQEISHRGRNNIILTNNRQI